MGDGVSNPAPSTHHHRPARRWALPSPFEAVPTAFSRLPLPLPPLRGGGWAEIAPSPAFLVPRSARSGNLGGSPRDAAGPDPAFPMDGRPSPRALPLTQSSTRLSGACFLRRGGQAPPRTPPSSPHHTSLHTAADPPIAPRFRLHTPILSRPLLACSPPSFHRSSVPHRSTPRLPRGFGEGAALCSHLGRFVDR